MNNNLKVNALIQKFLAPVVATMVGRDAVWASDEEVELVLARAIKQHADGYLKGKNRRCGAMTRRGTPCTRYAVLDWCRVHQRLHDHPPAKPEKVRCGGTTKKGAPCKRCFVPKGWRRMCFQHRSPEDEIVEEGSLRALELQVTAAKVELREILDREKKEDEAFHIRSACRKEILGLIQGRKPTEETLQKLSTRMAASLSALRERQGAFVARYLTTFEETLNQKLLPLDKAIQDFVGQEPATANPLLQRHNMIVMWAKSELSGTVEKTVEDLETYFREAIREFDLFVEDARRLGAGKKIRRRPEPRIF